MIGGVAGATSDPVAVPLQSASPAELEAQYRAYRRRQARGLIRLLPRDAVRPLYRQALSAGFADMAVEDPLGALMSYCELLLPLPPFEAWREDLRLHGAEHLADIDDSAEVPTAEAPTTVEARRFAYRDESWVAHLRCYRDGSTWRGYIAFASENAARLHRTALIFSERDAVAVRARFLDFDLASLRAFLRSACP